MAEVDARAGAGDGSDAAEVKKVVKHAQQHQIALDKVHAEKQNVKLWTLQGIEWVTKHHVLPEEKLPNPEADVGAKLTPEHILAIEKHAKFPEIRGHISKYFAPSHEEEIARAKLSAKQERKNERFAGQDGIMPTSQIPGGSPNMGQEDDGDTYKLKITLPTDSSADSTTQIGSEDMDPKLVATFGKLVKTVELASKDTNPSADTADDADVSQNALPSCALIAAGLAPGWSHRSHKNRVPPSLHRLPRSRCARAATWAAFLSTGQAASIQRGRPSP
jgi:hypothetical protein